MPSCLHLDWPVDVVPAVAWRARLVALARLIAAGWLVVSVACDARRGASERARGGDDAATICLPPPAVDTARWASVGDPAGELSFRLPRSFVLQAPLAGQPPSATRAAWSDGTRSIEVRWYHRRHPAQPAPGPSVCETRLGGLRALVQGKRLPAGTTLIVTWPDNPNVALIASGPRPYDAVLFWTVLRTARPATPLSQ